MICLKRLSSHQWTKLYVIIFSLQTGLQPSMDKTISHHLQPPERSSAQRDSDMESGNAHKTCYILSHVSDGKPSMDKTISHHLQPPERSSAQRDSDMESGNAHQMCYILK
ncbi:hypothetical protein DPMN_152484 [Dreissena polymorpha]|uniref:Uncharacterized protein n=1 Tax=Dreissena polymorpha TaxID=45954 RepID=A0A9D4FLC5_DREPO|nr:hypothetical protein DPMN_152484 [Dreissena polymorpha]